jgi:segregation and condensation protein B
MSSIKSKIESLLFISAKPMTVKQLSDLTKKSLEEIKSAGNELVDFYKNKKSGIQIIKNGSKYQMVSSPENSKLVQEFISDETTGELSRPSLETLTIIAYRGPILKIQIEKIRGVNCSIILRNLLLRGLVETKQGEDEEDILYSVTFDFIRYLGINEISELPNYDKLNTEEAIEKLLNEDGESSGDTNKDAKKSIEKEKVKITEVKVELGENEDGSDE